MGILNGTSNFILTRMTQDNSPFEEVLALAQEKGYAEQDPTFDVEGVDAAHKLAIITSLVTGDYPSLEDIHMEGISKITPLDIQFAREFGFTVKLLAIMKNSGQKVQARVHPALVPHDHVLASVDGAFNALHLTGDWVGDVLLYGLGAGRAATASAVVADVLDLARDLLVKSPGRVPALGLAQGRGDHLNLAPMEETDCQYYFRFTAADEPGVLAKVSQILSEHDISIETVIQKGRRSKGSVPIVMMTHEAVEKDVNKALTRMNALPQITEPTMLMRKA
jgi:homoserine dehydrogenase